MRENFLLMQDYHREVWRCAEVAWNMRKVPPCNVLKDKRKRLEGHLGKFGAGEKESLDKLIHSSKTIINAAANRSSFSFEGLPKTQMSLRLIKSTEKNLSNFFSRFDQILRVDYEGE